MQRRIAFVRLVIQLAREEVAEYIPGRGALCPVCARLELNPSPAAVNGTAWPVRYHSCDLCGNTFKSIDHTPAGEREGARPAQSEKQRKPVATPSAVAGKKKNRHRKK